jgi:hypothetical protein
LELTVEDESEAHDLITNHFESDGRALIQLRNRGSLIHGSVYNEILLQGAFQMSDVPPMLSQDRDDVDLVTFTFIDEYDPTWAHVWKAQVIDTLEAAP